MYLDDWNHWPKYYFREVAKMWGNIFKTEEVCVFCANVLSNNLNSPYIGSFVPKGGIVQSLVHFCFSSMVASGWPNFILSNNNVIQMETLYFDNSWVIWKQSDTKS